MLDPATILLSNNKPDMPAVTALPLNKKYTNIQYYTHIPLDISGLVDITKTKKYLFLFIQIKCSTEILPNCVLQQLQLNSGNLRSLN